jgi:DNA-binding response OmpR family regulator
VVRRNAMPAHVGRGAPQGALPTPTLADSVATQSSIRMLLQMISHQKQVQRRTRHALGNTIRCPSCKNKLDKVPLSIDLDLNEVSAPWDAGRRIKLTATQAIVLHVLYYYMPRFARTDQITRAIWGSHHEQTSNNLRVVLCEVRKAIAPLGLEILGKRGTRIGYKLSKRGTVEPDCPFCRSRGTKEGIVIENGAVSVAWLSSSVQLTPDQTIVLKILHGTMPDWVTLDELTRPVWCTRNVGNERNALRALVCRLRARIATLGLEIQCRKGSSASYRLARLQPQSDHVGVSPRPPSVAAAERGNRWDYRVLTRR